MNYKNTFLSILLAFLPINTISAQTISCTNELSTFQPADTNNNNWIVPSTGTTCVSNNLTIAYLEIANGGTLIIKPGVTLTITGGVRPDNIPTRTSTIQIYGELRFTQSATIPMSTNITIYSTGKLIVGNSGTNNISFKGNMTKILNSGIINVGTIDLTNNTSTNTFDNQGTFTVSGNINIQGTTYFKNTNNLSISSSFNNNANSVYVNCGTFNTTGFNLQGGKIYNVGSFTATGNINFGSSSAFFENYGTFSGTTVQFSGSPSYVYNSGNFTLSQTFQNDGSLRGPTTGANYGRFTINGKSSMNNGSVTGRLNLINSTGNGTGNSNAGAMFNNGITIGPNVVFGACPSCIIVTTGGVCLNPDGSMPITVTAVADNLTSTATGGSTTSVFANDVYNGGAAGSANATNVTLTKVGTWPAAFTLNTNGTITVAAGTTAANYPLQYSICATTDPAICSVATATVVVSPTVDAVADNFSATGVQAVNGAANVANVLANDTFNAGAAGSANTNNVAISVTTPAIPAYLNAPTPSLNTTTGVISIPAGTPAGTYTITYQVCEKVSGTPCDSATTEITVAAPAINAVVDNFTMQADGSNSTSLLANDTYNGGAAGSATPANVTLTQEGTWPTGIVLNTDGTVTVSEGTSASTYVLDYKICDKLNPTNCMNAEVTITVTECYKLAVFDANAGSTLDTATGITSLDRAGTASVWPAVRKSGWIVLEAKTKGFVLNRVQFNASNQPVAADGTTLVITSPIEGMMVYDITNNCLKVYTTTDGISFAWYCMETQACQD